MKTLNQIIRYTLQCEFSQDDWVNVLQHSRSIYPTIKLHRAIKPIYKSTFFDWLAWMDNGFGSGDIVCYGKTMGVVSQSVPGHTILSAYCDYEGNLIVKDMEVQAERLSLADDSKRQTFNKLLLDKGLEFSVKMGKPVPLYTPQKYSYVTFFDGTGVGMYLRSDDYRHYFVAAVYDNKLHMDCSIDRHCTVLQLAENKQINLLHKTTAAHGWTFNGRACQFTRTPAKGTQNAYWYISDRWVIVADKDNGSEKHKERFEAGNYFLDFAEATTFVKEMKAMRGK